MEIMQQLAVVAAVLLALAGALWGLRRRGFAAAVRPRRGDGRRLESLERLPLGPQHSLHLVRLGRKTLVVGCSPAGCTLLTDAAWPEVEPEARP